MKLITFKHPYDFGHDWYVQILHNKRWALLQASISWNDYPSWPYVQISFGNNSLLNVMSWAYKFGFDIGFIERTWNWNHLEELDENETELV